MTLVYTKVMKILIVEDEIKLAQALKTILDSEGYQATAAYDGTAAYELITRKKYDLIILDLNLPGIDGVTLCTRLRNEGSDVPVMMLTARDTTQDRILGLDSGADDYLVKPFDTNELLARLRALLRRQNKQVTQITIDSLEIDTQAAVVRRHNSEINLSATELSLLKCLAERADQVVSKEEVHEVVWGKPLPKKSKVVDVYVGYLRHKIDRDFPKEAPLMHTIKGRGYRLGRMKTNL